MLNTLAQQEINLTGGEASQNPDIVEICKIFQTVTPHVCLHTNLDILSESYLSLSIDYDNHTKGKNKFDLSSLSLSANASRNNIQLDVINLLKLILIYRRNQKQFHLEAFQMLFQLDLLLGKPDFITPKLDANQTLSCT